MRVDGYFTVENSVIIPIFTLIIVSLIALSFFLHDNVVILNALFQTAMKMEQSAANKTESECDDILANESEYIEAKTIVVNNVDTFYENKSKEIVCCSRVTYVKNGFFASLTVDKAVSVNKNRPQDYIRKINALEKLIK